MTQTTVQSAAKAESPLTLAPPPPPRMVTRRGRRRSWGEPRVRRWWALAILLVVVGGYFVTQQFIRSSEHRRLIRPDWRFQALITHANGAARPRLLTPEDAPVFTMEVKLPSGVKQITGRLEEQKEPLGPGSTIWLYVDPQNPAAWTDRAQAPIREDLLVGFMLLPLIVAFLAMAIFERMRLLHLWRTGDAVLGIVVEMRQAASAPFSRQVRFTLSEAREHRVFSTLIPTRLADLAPGSQFWLICRGGRASAAIVAGLYQ